MSDLRFAGDDNSDRVYAVTKLPEPLFQKLEAAAASHPPKRVVNPSERLNLGYDLFDDDGGVIVPDDASA